MITKQSINLYNFNESTGESKLLRARVFFALNTILAIVLFAAYTLKSGQKIYNERNAYSLTQEATKLEIIVNQKKAVVEQLKSNTKHYDLLNVRQKQLDRKLKLLNFLRTQKDPKQFSHYLVDLIDKSHPQMQLDEIVFDSYGQNIDFKGQSKSSKVVAQWLSSLEKTKSYDGVNFEKISIERDEEVEYLIFEVKNTYD